MTTSDLDGQAVPGHPGEIWSCQEIPIDEVGKYTARELQLLEKLGLFILEG